MSPVAVLVLLCVGAIAATMWMLADLERRDNDDDSPWCWTHSQLAELCGYENRNCDAGRQRPISPPPERSRDRRWGDGAGAFPPPLSESPGASGQVHCAVYHDGEWLCWCGATFATVSDALYGPHR